MGAEETHDVKLRQDDDLAFDIHIAEDGDFELEDSFDTSIIHSLFVDGRANQSDIGEPIERRGFWGDLIIFENEPTIQSGSKLWLVRGRRTEVNLNNAIDFCQKGLNWLIEKDFAKQINVTGEFSTNGIILDVTITVIDNSILKFNFRLWENGVVEVLRRA